MVSVWVVARRLKKTLRCNMQTVTFTIDQINTILSKLGKLPFVEVGALINEIVETANSQAAKQQEDQ